MCSPHPEQKVKVFTSTPMCWDQVSMSVICTPRNLVLLIISAAVLIMQRLWLAWADNNNDLLHFSDVQSQIVGFTPVH